MAVAPALAPWLVPAQRAAAALDAAGVDAGTDWFVTDAMVVGPGGVFALRHGHRSEAYVLEVRGLAQRAEAHLGEALGRRVPVVGLVTVRGVRKAFSTTAAPDGGPVVVVGRRGVQRWLDSTTPILTAAEVIEIRDALVAPQAAPKKRRSPRKKAAAL